MNKGFVNIQSKMALLLLMLVLILVGCSNTEETANSAPTETEKQGEVEEVNNEEHVDEEVVGGALPFTIIDHAGREVTFEKYPERIATVIPGDMELIYSLGGEVIGRPQISSGIFRPAEVESVEEIGFPLEINFEKLVSLQADLFIGHARLNFDDVATLESLGIDVILTKGDSLEDITSLIDMYGKILNRTSESESLLTTIEDRINEITASNNRETPLRTLVLFGTRDETMAALPQSLAGNLFDIAGAENIARDFPKLDLYPTYAQITHERILEANPDAIYFMAHGDAEEALQQFQSEMATNPIWNHLDAVKSDNLIILPQELFGTNPGPRIVDALEFLKESIDSIE